MTSIPDDAEQTDDHAGGSGVLVPMLAEGASPPESRIGERIRHARSKMGLSIDALSRLTREFDSTEQGVSQASISRYESGESLPGAREIRVLCDAIGAPSDWLLYGLLANSGRDEIEQSLLASIDRYIQKKIGDMDSPIVPKVNGIVRWDLHLKGTREELISKARRPPKQAKKSE